MLAPALLRDIVIKSGFVSEKDLGDAEKSATDLGKSIEDVLIYRSLISEDVLGHLIADSFKAPFIKLSQKIIPTDVLKLLPEEASRTFHIIPFAKEDGTLHLAMEDPTDLEAREFAKRKTGMNLKVFYASSIDLNIAIGQYKRNIKEVFTKIIEENIEKSPSDTDDVVKLAEDLPVIKILDTILEYATSESASDIHMEIMESQFLIRFRVDGLLRDVLSLPKKIHAAIIARIKILAQLKIDEHRIPQDGRFKFKIKDSFVALRVSILPGFFGENVVLRILPESARPLSLEELGIAGHNLEIVKRNIKKPHGMILVTGPTGSGKTTTLYAVLNILNTIKVNICTIEDPIEYGMNRITQIQVNPKAGLDFAAGLRALLRHDPNIIMVGEIRDEETAKIAVHSALTGHLVLSTLHTNDSAGAIPRFLDMGVEGYLVASTVNVIVAQRLIRKICPNCIVEYQPEKAIITKLTEDLGLDLKSQKFYKGQGCEECHMSGFLGRIGIYEVLPVSEAIRVLTSEKSSADKIQKAAEEEGLITMLHDGINKVAAGLTTIEEVLKAVKED